MNTPDGALEPNVVWSALQAIFDPEFGISIVDLGLIYDVMSEPQSVTVRMTLTTPACPSGGWIRDGVESAVTAIAGGRRVQVELVFDPPWGPHRLSATARELLGRSD